MIEIKIKSHLSVLISSIEKIYKKAQINGQLNIKELYYLNTIYKLLNNVELTNDQNNKLISLYNQLTYYSDNICPPKIIKKYQTTSKPKFEQAETTDCNTYAANKAIYYWQEPYSLNEADILLLLENPSYLADKAFDTYPNFDVGKNIDYTDIGKLVFVAIDANTTDLKIYDALNNDVTHTFDKTLYPIANGVIFISQNIYSHQNINFKIKET